MKKIDETNALIDTITELQEHSVLNSAALSQLAQVTMLADIAKSLAMIADSLNAEKENE